MIVVELMRRIKMKMRAFMGKAGLIVTAIVVKLIFIIYKLLAWSVPLLTIALVGWLVLSLRGYWGAGLALLLVLLSASALYHYAEETLPRSVGAGGWANRLSDRFIAWIGTLKFFTSPLCLVEDPGSYKIKGTDIRALLDGGTPLLQPGDILLRGYEGYLDGELIRRTGGAKGASRYFSHAALYVGPLDDQHDKAIAARRMEVMDDDGNWRAATEAEKDRLRNDPGYFEPGPQMVIHSMSKGVHVEDILTFVRCDYLVVLRLPELLQLSPEEAKNQPLVQLAGDALALDERLLRGEAVPRSEIVAAARDSALGRIGSAYDFQFDSSHTFHRFSCSEFVYYCYKSVHRHIGLKPVKHSFAGLFARTTVAPTDIYEVADPGGKLGIIWTNVPQKGQAKQGWFYPAASDGAQAP
jgi:hypothetical protein